MKIKPPVELKKIFLEKAKKGNLLIRDCEFSPSEQIVETTQKQFEDNYLEYLANCDKKFIG
jgi:hypothetical protein